MRMFTHSPTSGRRRSPARGPVRLAMLLSGAAIAGLAVAWRNSHMYGPWRYAGGGLSSYARRSDLQFYSGSGVNTKSS
jgi:hypothetical protein